MLVLANTKLVARLLASDFPSENPRSQTRNFPYTSTLPASMKNIRLIILISVLNLNFGLAQTESEINSLLNGISETENSVEIIKTKQAEKIIAYGQDSLPILAEFFTDSTLTKVKSECQKRYLTKGEIAIIMADRIEIMPYGHLTGVQNDIGEFCENNPNLIEYYFPWIRKDGTENYKNKYMNWLCSEDRLDFPTKLKGKARKERKKLIHEWRKNTNR